jgi:diadenosine tetraphosphate (Ap4A) HIT family hydrolase
MCANAGAPETAHGVRVYEGDRVDGYLGRYPVRPGYTVAIWKGRHVAEPTELTAEEAAGFWTEVGLLADAVEEAFQPAKMNWFHLGNGVPHLHVHLVPRPVEDARAGGPVAAEDFDLAATPPLDDAQLRAGADALRARLRG